MKKSEIKEITDMVMCATCKITENRFKSTFEFFYTNGSGFRSCVAIEGAFSEEEARKLLTERLLHSARSWQPRSTPRKVLEKDSLKGQEELLWWKHNMGMLDIVLHIAEMEKELDERFADLSRYDKICSKEYRRGLDKIRIEKQKHHLENFNIKSLLQKRSIVPLAWIKA